MFAVSKTDAYGSQSLDEQFLGSEHLNGRRWCDVRRYLFENMKTRLRSDIIFECLSTRPLKYSMVGAASGGTPQAWPGEVSWRQAWPWKGFDQSEKFSFHKRGGWVHPLKSNFLKRDDKMKPTRKTSGRIPPDPFISCVGRRTGSRTK